MRGACRFVVQVAIDLRAALLEIREKDRFFVLAEASHVLRRALCQQKSAAGCDLERLVRDLIAIAVGDEGQIDARAPDGLAIGCALELALAEGGGEGIRGQRGLPVRTRT